MLGDFNAHYDVANPSGNSDVGGKLNSLLESNNLVPLIAEPTRVTLNSSTVRKPVQKSSTSFSGPKLMMGLVIRLLSHAVRVFMFILLTSLICLLQLVNSRVNGSLQMLFLYLQMITVNSKRITILFLSWQVFPRFVKESSRVLGLATQRFIN